MNMQNTDRPLRKPEVDGENKANVRRGAIRRMVQVAIGILIQALVLFITAGRLDWAAAWVYLGVYLGIVIVNAVVLLSRSPELIAERGQVKANTKGWDRLLAGAVSLYLPLITLIVSGLDARFGWSAQPALIVQLIALIIMTLGYALVSWAMASNKFFSSVVRIQAERGHTVATAGPYQVVRHPGYTGMIAFTLATPVLLGSMWALIPALLNVCLFGLRTALEDRALQAELSGYQDYTRQVRYRLLPGVW